MPLKIEQFNIKLRFNEVSSNNLIQPINMILFQKQKVFSQSFSAFFKSRLNFSHFQKKDEAHK